MEIRHLLHFVALAEEGQFTAAARRMNIVQSGLSVTIKELEEELGVQLVNRTTRTVSLTDAGELFLEHARSSLLMLNNGVEAVRSRDGVVRGRLHLGILQSLGPYVDLPLLLKTFRSRYPQVEFSVRSLSTDKIPALVRSGYVDLSFHAPVDEKTWPGITTIPFARDSLVAICSSKHALAVRRTISLELLSKESFVDLTPERSLRTLVDRAFLENTLRRESVYQVSNVETMLQFVAGGLGVSIVPTALARASAYSKQLHVLPVTTQVHRLPKWRIVIATRTQRRQIPGKTTVELFLETLATLQATVKRRGLHVREKQ
jgi:DNA-binding transcriptional LysR family regulator